MPKIPSALLLLALSAPAFAMRTAVFPPEVRSRTSVWLDQGRVFLGEGAADRDRPIWIHGGDSLSSGWANRGTLRGKVQRGDREEIPSPRSFNDIMESLPDPMSTWYAGTKLNYGLLGLLERGFSKPWVVISTALAGARIYPRASNDPLAKEDPLGHMTEIEHPERVKLITFSLGNNDICDGFDPADSQNEGHLRESLRNLRRRYPQALVVPFEIIPVEAFYNRIQSALAQLPDTIGRRRVQEYCTKMWSQVCPQATDPRMNRVLAETRARLHKVFAEEGGHIYNPMASISDMETLDLLSVDCFHPSGRAQVKVFEPLGQMILKELGRP